MDFLHIYLGEGRGALMDGYVWIHIVILYYRTARSILTKLGRDEVLIVPYKFFFRPDPSRGGYRAGQK